jgi:outer membrane protein assembly factor BamB
MAVLLMVMAIGCKTAKQSPRSSQPVVQNEAQKDAEVLAALEQEYAIGPKAARNLGYRLGWQAPDAGENTAMISPQHDSIFVLSQNKNLQRLTADTGTRIWSVSAGTPAAEILGINYLKQNEQVYITHQGEITSLSVATGALTSEEGRSPIQTLQWMANTAPIVYQNNFIYGSKGGDLVWQAFNIGYAYKAFNIGDIIDIKPELAGDLLIGIARSGEVAAMDPRQVRLRWKHKLLDQITASPASNGSVLYVSCTDQYLRAFDLESGRLLWRALTETPLGISPVVIDDSVYQQIPGTGLASYEAVPVNRYDGRRLWLAQTVDGEVLTKRNGRLLVWNQDQRVLNVVSESTGVVESRLELDEVQMIVTDDKDNGRLYVLDDRGHLDCLIPLN